MWVYVEGGGGLKLHSMSYPVIAAERSCLERHLLRSGCLEVGDPSWNPGKGWRTKLKPYCLLQNVVINTYKDISYAFL